MIEEYTTNEFGLFTRYMRKAAGLTQAELSKETGWSLNAISQLERGIKLPHNNHIFEKKLRAVVKSQIKTNRIREQIGDVRSRLGAS